jgi:transposase
MILNGLGFSNRQMYLVPQYFANKPVQHLLGAGIKAEMLNDDCLGRTLDWLYAHDPTKLFAGITNQARQAFRISALQVHVDTTSFSVSGEYNSACEQVGEQVQEPGTLAEAMEAETALIAISYAYSRDHREDLKQWMCTTRSRRNVCLSKETCNETYCFTSSILPGHAIVVTQWYEALRTMKPEGWHWNREKTV